LTINDGLQHEDVKMLARLQLVGTFGDIEWYTTQIIPKISGGSWRR
jgi:hypothetical protein